MKKKAFFVFLVLLSLTLLFSFVNSTVYADELTDNISGQLNNLDLDKLNEFINSVSNNGFNISNNVYNLLNGKFNQDYGSIFNYIINVFFNNVIDLMPTLISIVAVAIFCGIIQSSKSKFLAEGIADIISFVCLLAVFLLISSNFYSIWTNTENAIKNIAKLCEIMSPIILTLMVASGGTVSASVYSPTVVFLSNGVINIILYAVIPLVFILTVFGIISTFSTTIKLDKFCEFSTGLIKWILGLTCTVFGLFISVQGITSATFDGVSLKAAKYAISNSVPLIGGFLKDGFDLVVAGSVLIKNSVGISCVIALFYILIKPVLYMAVFSLLLKLVSALIQPISDNSLPNLCTVLSKSITYLSVCLLCAFFAFFIVIILMIISANAFI